MCDRGAQDKLKHELNLIPRALTLSLTSAKIAGRVSFSRFTRAESVGAAEAKPARAAARTRADIGEHAYFKFEGGDARKEE